MQPNINFRRVAGTTIALFMAIGVYLWATSHPEKIEEIASIPENLMTSCEPMSEADAAKAQPLKIFAKAKNNPLEKFSYRYIVPPPPGYKPISVTIPPDIAIQAFNGWLLGGNRGEWGGELTYFVTKTNTHRLVGDNVENIYQMPFGFVAITGLAHGGLDDGSIFVVTQTESNIPIAKKLYSLPSAPVSSWLLESGDLLVNTRQGSVILKRSGVLKPFDCKFKEEIGT